MRHCSQLANILLACLLILSFASCRRTPADSESSGSQDGGQSSDATGGIVDRSQPGGTSLADGLTAFALDSSQQNATADDTGPSAKTTLFQTLTAADCGISFVPEWKPRDTYEAQFLRTGFTGGGVSLGDYNGDGLPDVFLTRPHGGGRLYKNLGEFRFADVTQQAGVARPGDWQTGSTWNDINNDGALDLIVSCLNAPNRVFLNQTDGTFSDITNDCGLNFLGATIKTIFADYDQDGDLDAYVITNRQEPRQPVKIRYVGKPGAYDVAREHQELAQVINLPNGEQKFAKAGQRDRLYRNELVPQGVLRFSDVSQSAGIDGVFHGLDGCWWDPDGDGDADLYITNDFTDPDQYYRNNGDGSFTDISGTALPCTPWFAMGCASGDLNNDGWLDLLAADMAGTSHYREKIAMGSMDAVAWFLDTAEPRQFMRNVLYLNSGTPRFREAAHLAGLAKSDWTWSVKLADFDNDGRLDVFFTNGFTRDYLNSDFNNRLKQSGKQGRQTLAWYDAPKLEEQNLAFRNQGDLRFANVSKRWGLDTVGISFGAATGDLDNDGDLDLIVNNFGAPPSIYRNRSKDAVVCKLQLKGSVSSRQPVGATVRVETADEKQVRYYHPAGGFLSCDDDAIHVGLGQAAKIDLLEVRWPMGQTQRFRDLPVNRRFVIQQPDAGATRETTGKGELDDNSPPSTPAMMLTETQTLRDVQHEETPYDDFENQPLLPNKMSQLGPGLAAGDADGDGRVEIFVGGAAGQAGRVLRQTDAGGWQTVDVPDLQLAQDAEDMGCVWFDADGDGDPDLFVVSGGVEATDDGLYQDRLYRNDSADGQIRLSLVADALPTAQHSGGPVAVADFDQDGDLDLFVGGRVVPGQYPLAPTSMLLLNTGGSFQTATGSDVDKLGMVTAALWSDYDDDGWLDLIVAEDYGPVRVLRNDAGTLRDVSDAAGTLASPGWWNSLQGCDIDLDGDTDYIVGNLGQNTKYHPHADKPQLLYYGSFEGDKHRIVEAKSTAAGLLPVRGRSCSSNAMPFIAEKFDTYHAFASASLADIYTEHQLDAAHRVQATETRTGIWRNIQTDDGKRQFVFEPLPTAAQLAPVFGIDVLHLNDDPYPDLCLAQNFYTPQRETGRMSGGIGSVLLGSADGTFHAVDARTSGLVMPEDAKSSLVVDLDADGRLDWLVGINDGPLRCWSTTRRVPSQPTDWPIGAAVRVKIGDKQVAKFERYQGSGYLASGTSPWAQLPHTEDAKIVPPPATD